MGRGLVNSEQRRRLSRLVNRLTKILSEAGKHKNQIKTNGQRLAGYIPITLKTLKTGQSPWRTEHRLPRLLGSTHIADAPSPKLRRPAEV